MTSRNIVKLFMTTLLVGGVSTAVVGIIVRWKEFASTLANFEILQIAGMLVWLFGVGLIFSVISQMGFFAYLTIHRFGMSLFRSLWNPVQVILILFALFDLVYLRYSKFSVEDSSLFPYFIPALIVLIAAIVVAVIKVKKTNPSAFIPALFFMVVVTIIEWLSVLVVNDLSWIYLMIFPLIICNAYQLIILQKLNEDSKRERENHVKKPS